MKRPSLKEFYNLFQTLKRIKENPGFEISCVLGDERYLPHGQIIEVDRYDKNNNRIGLVLEQLGMMYELNSSVKLKENDRKFLDTVRSIYEDFRYKE